MTQALWAAQDALFARLSQSSALQALLGNPARIFDYVPSDTQFPYIMLGGVDARPYDTSDICGYEQNISLNVFSQGHGHKELKIITDEIYSILHRAEDITIDGQALVNCQMLSVSTRRLSDRRTTEAQIRLRLVTQNV